MSVYLPTGSRELMAKLELITSHLCTMTTDRWWFVQLWKWICLDADMIQLCLVSFPISIFISIANCAQQ